MRDRAYGHIELMKGEVFGSLNYTGHHKDEQRK